MERERQNREEWLRSEGTAFPGENLRGMFAQTAFNDAAGHPVSRR